MAGTGVLNHATFPLPDKFVGKREQFEEFAYKLRAYMSLLNPAFEHMFKSLYDNPGRALRDEGLYEVQQASANDGTVAQVVVTETKQAQLAALLQTCSDRFVYRASEHVISSASNLERL